MVEENPTFFTRKKQFEGLEEYFDSKEIKVRSKNIHYPLQLSFFNKPEDDFGLRVKSGYFYEVLSQGIYGGSIKEIQELKNKQEESLVSEPDVSDKKNFREIKSIRYNGDLQLVDSQIAKYCLLEKQIMGKKKKINFVIFRHGLKNFQKNFSKEGVPFLLESLTEHTNSMIYLPFRVIFDLYNSKSSPRYDGNAYRTMTRIYSSHLNNLLKNPEETLESFGVDMEGLKISKRKFPSGIEVNGKEITPFPTLVVKGKETKQWQEKFNDFFEDRSYKSLDFKLVMESFNGEGFNEEQEDFPWGEENHGPLDDCPF